jgi:hypothetical protein
LTDLPAPNGATSLTPAKHRASPGHGAPLTDSDEDGHELAYLCLNP